MKKPILTALALFILTPNGALDAGPWLREKGESFTSFSLTPASSATPTAPATWSTA